ncbi:hypothetical protein P7D22_17250 [Lichenihabitans sp. Uapishka_5]|uniref:hypothetical protein n=1 Tax=Lichenihabitans sp. Uapishka_5 TaxID=3037302 RepID=UPI0029E7FA89|nr:hypothetical protein [Lichenihabitans sp. Uapishka_5]MDX7952915.1 hypothetical protein [Lichenihabitans sp. Uapishka_5]
MSGGNASNPDDGEATPWRGTEAAIALSNVGPVRALLVAAVRQQQALTYAALLNALGHPFTRPRMRAVCRTLDAIDEAGHAAGEPELAVLVVRQSDGLPGQGWWVSRLSYPGPWRGPEATIFVRELQEVAFGFWNNMPLGGRSHQPGPPPL